MPAAAISSTSPASSARVAPTQLRWAIASIPSSCLSHLVTSSVRLRVDRRGAVGDRREVRAERAQVGQRGPQLLFALVGLGREELEREDRALARGDDLVDPHLGHSTNLDMSVSRLSSVVRTVTTRPPALDHAIGLACGSPRDLEVAQVAERLGDPPCRSRRRQRASEDASTSSRAVPRRGGERLTHRLQVRGRPACGWRRCGRGLGERAPMARQAQTRVERLDHLERVQELADRVRRVAVVEVAATCARAGGRRRSAAVAPAGRSRHVTARVPGVSWTRPGAEVGVDHDPVDQLAVRLDRAATPDPIPLIRSRYSSSAASLTPPWRPISSRRSSAASGSSSDAVAWPKLGCIHTSHPARSRTGPAWPQWSGWAWVMTIRLICRRRQADIVQRALQIGHRARVVHARVEQHDPAVASDRPGVAVWNPLEGQRQPQPPESGQDPLAATHLTIARHRCDDIGCERDVSRGRRLRGTDGFKLGDRQAVPARARRPRRRRRRSPAGRRARSIGSSDSGT